MNLVIGGEAAEGELNVQEAFSSFFASIGKNIASIATLLRPKPEFRSYLGSSCVKSMFLEPVTVSEITKIVNGLKNSSSSGQDSIPTKVVKSILPSIAVPLTKLVNLQLKYSVFRMLSSVLGLLLCIKNYRRISVLSVFSKIFRKGYAFSSPYFSKI